MLHAHGFHSSSEPDACARVISIYETDKNAQVNKSINFQDKNAFVAFLSVHRLNEASFSLAVTAHSTLRSMLSQAKHYVTDRRSRLVAMHRLSADVRYRWRPMPKPMHKGWKLRIPHEWIFAFTAFWFYFVLVYYCVWMWIVVVVHCGFLFVISRFL